MVDLASSAIVAPLYSSSEVMGNPTNIQFEPSIMKRKTPSELRAEQFKRMRSVSSEASKSLLTAEMSNSAVASGSKKVESSKPPRYIDTRVADIYPVTKSGDRLKLLGFREKFKDSPSFQNQTNELSQNSTLSNANLSSNFFWRSNGNKTSSNDPNASTNSPCANENAEEKAGTHVQNKFRNVAELSSSSPAVSFGASIDMAKVLKGLAGTKVSALATPIHNSEGPLGASGSSVSTNSFNHELQIPGDKVPLDLSLKVSMRLVSSTSLNWCNRLNTTCQYMGMKEFIFPCDSRQENGCTGNKIRSAFHEVSFWKALHSWMYPQSSLPASVISAMALSAARGGTAENDFLSKRQSAWEDSFRCIYYMLRNRMCNLFYFCTQQFVVMFMGGGVTEKMDGACSAYLTRSTRGLRALLKEHDVGFSMPLCRTEVEQVTTEELHELSEFEKSNPGQTRFVDSMADVDNSSQSLLAFFGNKNVHGLYDFLLNHRSFLGSVACTDVPVLYSPVPFQNASLYVPDVSCKQMKRADAVLKPCIGATADTSDSAVNSFVEASGNVSYVIEIKEAILPPWVISRICAAIVADQKTFETTFVTEPLSGGLNIALDPYCQKGPGENLTKTVIDSIGNFADTVLSPCLGSAVVKHLKYLDGSYVASLSSF